jgi:hypothetical protein
MNSWLQLVVTLPTQGATARMRIWRAVKVLGCASLRDGVYLLPRTDHHLDALQALADDCVKQGGAAWVAAIEPLGDPSDYDALFDRHDDYTAMRQTWKEQATTLTQMQAGELTRLLRKLEREFDALRAIDFFPGEASVEADAAWQDFRAKLQRVLAPDEPQGTRGAVPRLDAAAYQGRVWATRKRLWVDRVASAWLIRRFIDPTARFQWLAKPADCPKKALGFDFDGATFTHVGERVTFETLLASFGLEKDAALVRLGAMVHSLDVSGEPVAEAKGFEAVLAGARERLSDDDALLAEIGGVLDSLYVHFEREATRSKP